jgi:hypothetical protein
MGNKFTVAIAVAAGFAGGLLSRYASPSPVHAQAPAVQQEVRAEKFVLVDKGGAPRGAFGIETDGTAQIEITDNKGRVYLYQTYNPKFFSNAPSREGNPKVASLLH